jgi:hypothetical protein
MVERANERLLEAEAILRNLMLAERTRASGGRNRPQSRPYCIGDAKADARRALDHIGAARLALLGAKAFLDTPGVKGARCTYPDCSCDGPAEDGGCADPKVRTAGVRGPDGAKP